MFEEPEHYHEDSMCIFSTRSILDYVPTANIQRGAGNGEFSWGKVYFSERLPQSPNDTSFAIKIYWIFIFIKSLNMFNQICGLFRGWFKAFVTDTGLVVCIESLHRSAVCRIFCI